MSQADAVHSTGATLFLHPNALTGDELCFGMKRQMYGRAKIDLLQARLIGAA